MTTGETRTYMAGSVLNSRTMLFSVLTIISGILAMPEVTTLIPVKYTPYMLTVAGMVGMLLRVLTVRPVTFSAPGSVTPVQVKKIDPPGELVSD